MNDLTDLIVMWGIERKLQDQEPEKQMLKVVEEVGEIASALARGDRDELVDAIGDTYVTLVMLCLQSGINIKGAVQAAYDEIKDRKGKLVNGVFVKQEDLNKKEAI